MTSFNIEVFYEHAPTHKELFPLEEDEIHENLVRLPNHLEYVIQNDSHVVVLNEDFPNHRMSVQIEANAQKDEILRSLQNVLNQNKLSWRRL